MGNEERLGKVKAIARQLAGVPYFYMLILSCYHRTRKQFRLFYQGNIPISITKYTYRLNILCNFKMLRNKWRKLVTGDEKKRYHFQK